MILELEKARGFKAKLRSGKSRWGAQLALSDPAKECRARGDNLLLVAGDDTSLAAEARRYMQEHSD
jgi:hypothetical protein